MFWQLLPGMVAKLLASMAGLKCQMEQHLVHPMLRNGRFGMQIRIPIHAQQQIARMLVQALTTRKILRTILRGIYTRHILITGMKRDQANQIPLSPQGGRKLALTIKHGRYLGPTPETQLLGKIILRILPGSGMEIG